jgi:hypothetical protein
MSILEDLSGLTPERIEDIEKLTLRWLFQATLDFGFDAYDIFFQSPDDVKDVAEDIVEELLTRLPGYNLPQRILGTVDYKKARYIILPEMMIRQALFVDSKAEKEDRTATLQMSQTSMIVRQKRSGVDVVEQGTLPKISRYAARQYLTTTAFVHFLYKDDAENFHHLKKATICCIPNGLLQDLYNPDSDSTIWLAGRNAPTLGEVFRVRLSFALLKRARPWRVQHIYYDEAAETCTGNWEG